MISACQASGRNFFVIAIEDQADPETVDGVPHAWNRLGAVGTSLDLLREAGVEELVLAGRIKRPSMLAMRPDRLTAGILAKLGKHALGDDALLTALVEHLESEGFRVVGPDDVVADLVVREGTYGSVRPDQQAERDIDYGIEVARRLGAADVGQAVVVQQGLVLAVEAIEGTDAMVARAGDLRREGPGGVLVKVSKPGQERRTDLPTVGPDTVHNAAAAGLRGIAVESGSALVIDSDAVVRAADAAGLFVVGVAVPE